MAKNDAAATDDLVTAVDDPAAAADDAASTGSSLELDEAATTDDPAAATDDAASTGSSPKLDHFHFFPLLPKELRNCIWELMCPLQPGAHYFRVVDLVRDGPTHHLAMDKTGTQTRRYRLAAPSEPRLAGPSWISGNPSSYLLHSALTRTCRESRQVAARLLNGLPGPWQSVHIVLPDARGRPPSEAVELEFRFRPAHDLFHAEFTDHLDMSVTDWTRQELAPDIPQLCDVEHMALAYPHRCDALWPAMRRIIRSRSLPPGTFMIPNPPNFLLHLGNSMLRLAGRAPKLKVLYLVDYEITPRSGGAGVRPDEGGAPVFYARGMRFYHVTATDHNWHVKTKVFGFKTWFQRECDLMQTGPEPWWRRTPTCRILACVPEDEARRL